MSGQAKISSFFSTCLKRAHPDEHSREVNRPAVPTCSGRAAASKAVQQHKQQGGVPASSQPAAARPQKRSRGSGGVQLHLDLGQSDFVLSHCHVCGMLYSKGQPEDEKLHRQQHQVYTHGMQLQSCPPGDVVLRDGTRGHVLQVSSTSGTAATKRLSELCRLVEQLHGMAPGWLLSCSAWKAFLYVCSKQVVGLVVVEQIRTAYRVVAAEVGAAAAGTEARPGTGAVHPAPAGIGATSEAAPAAAAPAEASGCRAAAVAAAAGAEPAGAARAAQPDQLQQHSAADVIAGEASACTVPSQAVPGTVSKACAGAAAGAAAAAAAAAAGQHLLMQAPCNQLLHQAAKSTAEAEAEATPCASNSQQRAAPEATSLQAAAVKDQPARVALAAAPGRLASSGSGTCAAAKRSPQAAAGSRPLPPVDRSQQVKAMCGVRLVWVSSQHRRVGIASRLLDVARCHLVPGYVVGKAQVAFSQPTAAGVALAEQYVGSSCFLVYGV